MRRPPGDEPLDRVREMRRFSTDAEAALWQLLRGRRLGGAKFRRQVWISRYIADFYCAESRLIVEADGGQHQERQAEDKRRSSWLEDAGFRVIRFWNDDVLANPEGVAAAIARALTLPPPCGRWAPPSPLQGEGK